MSDERFVEGGETWIEIEVIARCYHVEVSFLRDAYSLGLFGPGVQRGAHLAIAAIQLDRVATVVRLHVYQGVDLQGIALFLGEPERS